MLCTLWQWWFEWITVLETAGRCIYSSIFSPLTNSLVQCALCALQREVLFSLFNFVSVNMSIFSCSLLPIHKLKIADVHFRFQKVIDCLTAQAANLDHSWLQQFSLSDLLVKTGGHLFYWGFSCTVFDICVSKWSLITFHRYYSSCPQQQASLNF